MNAWVRSQPRTLRPYFGAEAAETLLDEMELVLKIGDPPVPTRRLIIDEMQMAEISPRLYPKLSETRLDEVFGQRRSAFDLVVTLRTPQMLRRELVARYALSGEAPEVVDIPDQSLGDARLTGLFELGVSICLRDEKDLGAGWPEQIGSWVSRGTFTIGLDRRQSAFRIEILTEAMIKERALPTGTMVWVDVDDLNVVYEEGTACATAYVNEKLHDKFTSGKTHPAVTALLYAEIVCAVLAAPDNGVKEATEIVSGSPLENIAKNLSTTRALSLRELKKLIDDPARLRATVHDSRGLVKDLEKV